MLSLTLDSKFKSLIYTYFLIGCEQGVVIAKYYDSRLLYPMFLKYYHHLHPLSKAKSSFVDKEKMMKISIWRSLK